MGKSQSVVALTDSVPDQALIVTTPKRLYPNPLVAVANVSGDGFLITTAHNAKERW